MGLDHLDYARILAIALTAAMIAPTTAAWTPGGACSTVEDGGLAPQLGTLGQSVLAPTPVGSSAFIENRGQFHDDGVRLYAVLPQGGIAFKSGCVVMNVEDTGTAVPAPGPLGLASLEREGPAMFQKLLDSRVYGCTVTLTFEGARDVAPVGLDPTPGTYNYILGDHPAIEGVRTYSEVLYDELYVGIDLVYRMTPQGLKYEFLLEPGIDPAVISVRVEGHRELSVDRGVLSIGTSLTAIRDEGLKVFYQGSPETVLDARFELRGPDRYGFTVVDRDPSRTLVIDPIVFSTYLGTQDWEMGEGIDTDDEGNSYVTGWSDSNKFPTTPGAYQENIKASYDVFVTKVSRDGRSLVYSTFIGGHDADIAKDIVVDSKGNAYVTGYTLSSNFPTTLDAYQEDLAGPTDCFVAKLDPTGSRLLASTLVGGPGSEMAKAVAVDPSGNMYLTGISEGSIFPLTQNAPDDVNRGYSEAFVCKLNATATDLVYSTYLGGLSEDEGQCIVVDTGGIAYVGGVTWSTDFPVTDDAYQTVRNGTRKTAFVTRVSVNGSSFEASTYLGGAQYDTAKAIDLDPDGDVHVVGFTMSMDFPTTPGAYQTAINPGAFEGFVTRLNWNLSAIVTSTFIGGGGGDEALDGELDPDGNVLICGYTESVDFPVTTGAAQTEMDGTSDGFVTKLSGNYTRLLYSTFLGGIDYDGMNSVSAQGSLYAHVTGETFSTDYPTTPRAFQTGLGGQRDTFVTRLSQDLEPPVADAGPDMTVDQHATALFNGTLSHDNVDIINFTWSFAYGGGPVKLYGPVTSWTFDDAGSYTVTLRVVDEARHVATDTLNVSVRDITPPVADAGLSKQIRQGEVVNFDGSGSWDNVGIVNWTWTFGYHGENVTLDGETASFQFDKVGRFNVTLKVLDAEGNNATDSLWIDVLDLTSPTAEAGPDIHVDQHETVTLDGSLSWDSVGIVNWTWTFVHAGIPEVLYGEATIFVFTVVGSYEVVLRVEDAAGNYAIDMLTVNVRDSTPPIADAGEDKAVDQGAWVEFDGSGSTDNVGIASYHWTLVHDGKAVSLEGPRPTFLFEEAGTFQVTLNVTDGEGNWAEDTMTVTVRDVTAPVAVAGDDHTIGQGQTVGFDGSSSHDNVGIISYTWTFLYDEEPQELTGVTASFTFDHAGKVRVTLEVEDAAGNFAMDQVEVTVVDTTPPIPRPGDDMTADQGTEVTFDGTASTDNVGIVSHEWTVLGTATGPVTLPGVTVTHYFATPGTYTVELKVTDAAGNTAKGSLQLKVRDTTIPVAISRGDRKVSVGEGAKWNGEGSYDNVGIVSYKWTFKEGGRTVELDGERVEHAFDARGTYKVTLTVTDADGNSATDTFEVTVTGGTLMYAVLAIVVVAVLVALMALMKLRRRRGTEAPDAVGETELA